MSAAPEPRPKAPSPAPPAIAWAVLALGCLAAILLGIGLFLALRQGTMDAPIVIEPSRWAHELARGHPAPFFAAGVLLLLSLPLLRDALLALHAIRHRERTLAFCSIVGALMLAALYTLLWQRGARDPPLKGPDTPCEMNDGCGAPENQARASRR